MAKRYMSVGTLLCQVYELFHRNTNNRNGSVSPDIQPKYLRLCERYKDYGFLQFWPLFFPGIILQFYCVEVTARPVIMIMICFIMMSNAVGDDYLLFGYLILIGVKLGLREENLLVTYRVDSRIFTLIVQVNSFKLFILNSSSRDVSYNTYLLYFSIL